jgi:hypothetical protein
MGDQLIVVRARALVDGRQKAIANILSKGEFCARMAVIVNLLPTETRHGRHCRTVATILEFEAANKAAQALLDRAKDVKKITAGLLIIVWEYPKLPQVNRSI